MDDYFLECDLARAICRGDEKDWPSYMEQARVMIASVRKAGYEVVRPKRRNTPRTETAQHQPPASDSNVNETGADAG